MAERHRTLYEHLKPLLMADVQRLMRTRATGAGGGGSSSSFTDINDTTGTLSWIRVSKIGSSISHIENRAHSLLSNLEADDHEQYVHISSARTIVAGHTFNRSGAPFLIGASSNGQLVTGLNAQQVGGQLESAFMRRDATSNLDMNEFVITSDDGNVTYNLSHLVTGSHSAGATWVGLRNRALSSAPGNTMILQSDAGQTLLNAASGQNISFRNDNTALATLDASNWTLLSPLMLKTTNYASQTTGWGVTYAGAGDFRYLFADEMHVKVLIADLEQALAGGQIISKSVAVLSRDFTAPAAGASTTIYLEDLPSAENMAVFESGDILRVRQFSRAAGSLSITNCWGVVTSYSNLTGKEQSWTFTRSSAPNAGAMTGGAVIGAGAIVLDYGTTGNGFYEVNAIDGLYAVNSPYMQIVTWATHPHSGQTVRVRVGNLTGVGFTGEYGLYAAGGASSEQYLKASDDSFVLAAGPAGSTTIDENGVNIEIGTSFDDDEAYTFSSGGTIDGRWAMAHSGSYITSEIRVGTIASTDVLIDFRASAVSAGRYADTYIGSTHNIRSNNPAQLRFYATDSASTITAYGERFEMTEANVCFATADEIVTGYINIYMGGTGHLYARFPNGTIVELAAD